MAKLTLIKIIHGVIIRVKKKRVVVWLSFRPNFYFTLEKSILEKKLIVKIVFSLYL